MIGWQRRGSRGRFHYVDANGAKLTDEAQLERIRALAIPPAWRDVWVARSARAKLQATGYDAAGRKQYLYHADFRARQEQAKYDKLILFAERLPQLREAMAAHMELEGLPLEKVAAIAVRLINLGWFRVGGERYAKQSRTFGITTLRKSHVTVRGARISFKFRGKHSILLRSAVVDPELAQAMRDLLALPGRPPLPVPARGRHPLQPRPAPAQRVHQGASRRGVHGQGLPHLGRHADRGDRARPGRRAVPETDAKRKVAAVMRHVGEKLGNTPAVARSSYVSPAVVEQYLDGRTIEDFRPRHLRVVQARGLGLDTEELATLSLLRSWRIRAQRAAA